MNFNKLLLAFCIMFAACAHATHVSDRPIYATDITNKSGTSVFKFPTSLPLASRACVMNGDRELTNSAVTNVELDFLSGVTSGIQNQLNGKAASSHTHAIANVTGLQGALDAKAALAHLHAIADTTGLQAALDAKAALSHAHVLVDITDAGTAAAANTTDFAAASHTHIIADTTGLQVALNAKAASSHNHAESDVTNLVSDLAGKAASVHTHTESDVTGLVSDLAAKADASATTTALAGKESILTFTAPLARSTNTISCNVASGSQPGCVSTSDWNMFNSKQAGDSDLTTIAGLSPSNDDFLQFKSSAWVNRTKSQVKTDLDLTGTNSGDQTITLTSDVTGSGTGSFATTVASVGGSTAANVHAAELLANAATNTLTASTIVKRDSSSNFHANGVYQDISYIATAGGSTNLTTGSPQNLVFTGSSAQTIKLLATSSFSGRDLKRIINSSTGTLTVNDSSSVLVATIAPGQTGYFRAKDNTSPGTWDVKIFSSPSSTDIFTNKSISGSANTLTNLPASGISGVIPIANLATGTPDGTKFIRDDGTLVTPAGGGGSSACGEQTITSNTTLTANSTQCEMIYCNPASANTTITFPAAGTGPTPDKKIYYVKRAASTSWSCSITGVIDGATRTKILEAPHDYGVYMADSSDNEYKEIARKGLTYLGFNSGTGTVTVAQDQNFWQANNTTGTLTWDLTAIPVAQNVGTTLFFVKLQAGGTAVIDPNASETILVNGTGQTTLTLSKPGDFVQLTSNGAQWQITSNGTGFVDTPAATATPDMIKMCHNTQTGTTSTDCVNLGYPTGSSSDFVMKYLESGSFDFNYGTTPFIHTTSTTMQIKVPGAANVAFDMNANDVYISGGSSTGKIYTDSHFIPEAAIGLRVSATSTNATTTTTSQPIQVTNASGGNKTVTLATGSLNSPINIFVKKDYDSSNNTVGIIPAGSENLDGVNETKYLEAMGDSVLIAPKNSNSYILADSRSAKVISVTTNTTLSADLRRDMTVLCDATSGNVTITGYASAGRKGWKVTLKKIDSSGNTCTYDANASETIDGSTTSVISTQWAGKTYQADGTNHVIVGSF